MSLSITPLRASAYVLNRRMRVTHWLLIAAGALVAGLSMFAASWSGADAFAQGESNVYLMVGMLLLGTYGAMLALAANAVAGIGRALVPGAGRMLWRACGSIGVIAIALALLIWLGLAWQMHLPPRPWYWLATTSAAFAAGFAWVFVWHGRHGRAVFLGIALLVLTAWPSTHDADALATPSPWLLAVWTLSWPACLWQFARAAAASAQALPAVSPKAAGWGDGWQAMVLRLRRRGFDASRADPRWLMHTRWRSVGLADVLGSMALFIVMVWVFRGPGQTLLWLSLMLLMASASSAVEVLDTGARPRLLLLPGGHRRQCLAWTMFRAMLRRSLGIAAIAAVIGLPGAALGGVDTALRAVCIGLGLVGLLVMVFGGLVAFRAWVPYPGLRTAILLPAMVCLVTVGGWWLAMQAIGATHADAWPMLSGALAIASLQALLGAALVWASARAWARIDLAPFAQPRRRNEVFGLTTR